MEYRRLGNSGLKVSAIGLGGNNFGWWADEQTSITVIDHAIEKGINFIDTADIYDRGHSEEFVGKAIKGKRLQVFIATKFGNPMGEGPEEPPADARLSRPNVAFRRIFTEDNWDKLAKLEVFARERGHTAGELAIAWLLAKPWVSTVIAGARKIEQVSANVTAGEWKLTAEEVAKVDAIS